MQFGDWSSDVCSSDLTEGVAGGFGPLRAILGAISAVYTDHKVRSQPLLTILLSRVDSQETVVTKNKIEDILSRVAILETLFATSPGDVAEQRRRDQLIRYVVIPPLDSILSSIQQVQGHRRTTAAFIRESRSSATGRACSRRRRGFWAS